MALVLLQWLAPACARADEPRIVAVWALEDANGALSLQQAIGADGWRRLDSARLARSYTRSVWWLRIEIASPRPTPAVLSVLPPYLDDVRFHWQAGDADAPAPADAPFLESHQGDTQPTANRRYPSRSFNVALPLAADAPRTVYLRTETSSSMLVLPEIQSPAAFERQDMLENLGFGLLSGIALAILTLAVLMYRSSRDPLYGHYTGAALAYLLYIACVNGYSALLVFDQGPVGSKVTNAVILVNIAASALLVRQLLEVKRFSRAFSGLLLAIAAAEVACAVLALFGHYALFARYAVPVGLVTPIINMWLTWMARSRGLGLSRRMMIAFMLVPLGHLPLLWGLIGMYDTPPWALYLGQYASVLYMLVLIPEMIDRRKREERRLAQTEFDAEFALRTIEQQRRMHEAQREWVAMVSHEIKTPLSVIDSSRQSLERLAPTPVVSERLARMKRGVERIDALVGTLLSQREYEARHAGIRPTTVELGPWLKSLTEAASGEDASRVSVDADAELQARVDPDLLGIAVNNLLHNALRHGALGATVEIAARRTRADLEIEVRSRGEPIPEEAKDRLFDRAVSFGSHGGHGIGLWACRTIAQAHGGDVRLETTPTGNRFVLAIPQPTLDSAAIPRDDRQ